MALQLNKAEKSALRNVMESDPWTVVIQALDQRLTELRKQKINGEDAFQTLRSMHTRDGGVEALEQFFEDLDRNANA